MKKLESQQNVIVIYMNSITEASQNGNELKTSKLCSFYNIKYTNILKNGKYLIGICLY